MDKCFHFIKKEIQNKDEKLTSAERIVEDSLRFTDSYDYLDTMTLSSEILGQHDRLFEALNIISD